MADRKVIQFTGTDGNEYDVRDEAAQQMIGTTALPTTAQTLTGAIAEHETDLGTKAEKVVSAVNGNFAGLDGNGNLTDSGSKASDFVPVDREINGKALSADVTLTGDDITVSSEDEQTVSDAIESKADQTQVDDIEKELTGKADKDSVFDYKGAVPGDVVEVYDAVAEAVKTMQIEIVPVQDLHGYDKPWVGGAGKNLIEPKMETSSANGVTCTNNNDGSFTLTTSGGSSTSVTTFRIDQSTRVGTDNLKNYSSGDYTVSGLSNSIRLTVMKNEGSAPVLEFTGNETLNVASDQTGCFMYLRIAAGVTLDNITIKPMLEKGTTASEWEPYSNICPISGFTGCEMTRDGANLIDPSLNTYDKYIDTEGSIKTSNGGLYYTGLIPVVPGENYIVDLKDEINTTSGASGRAVSGYKADGTFDSRIWSYNVQPGTYDRITDVVTIPSGVYFVRLNCNKNAGSSTFYRGDTYAITFPSGQTVYGGTLTINADGTGTLVVDHKNYVLPLTGWSLGQSGLYVGMPSDCISPNTSAAQSDGKCTHFNQVWNIVPSAFRALDNVACYCHGDISNSKRMYIRASQFADASAFETFLSAQNTAGTPVSLTYRLAEQQTIQLTAPQIRTILGYNRIYANTGSILSMLYPAEKYQTAEQADRERIHAVVDEPSAVVSVTDGADNVPMGMQIAIDPVQDLHGQSSPYPGGAGKNKLDVSGFESRTHNNLNFVNNGDGTISISQTANALTFLPIGTVQTAGTYVLNGCPANGGESSYRLDIRRDGSVVPNSVDNGSGSSAVELNVGDAVYIRIANGYAISGTLLLKPMLRLSTETDATFVPYSNICPITGWTGAEVTRTGKNLFDKSVAIHDQKIRLDDGSETGNAVSNYTDPIGGILPNTEYTISGTLDTISTGSRIYYLDKYKNWISRSAVFYSTPHTFTTPDNCRFIEVQYIRASGDLNTICVNEGSTAIDYEPFGQTYSITFPSSAGTVYGGSLTVNKDGTGTLVVDKAELNFNSAAITWEYVSEANHQFFRGTINGIKRASSATTVADILSSIYVKDAAQNVYNHVNPYTIAVSSDRDSVMIYDSRYNDLNTFKESVANEMFVYCIATPITYTLSAPVIRSLLGTNNVWADTGNVLHLDYTADTKSYIDKAADNRITSVLNAMVAPVLPSMIADTALSVNDFRIVNDTLYRVTASIASGGTLTVGTNVVKTSIGEQITALLNAN